MVVQRFLGLWRRFGVLGVAFAKGEKRRASTLGWVLPWVLLFVCGLLQGACSCITSEAPPPREVVACVPQHTARLTTWPSAPSIETVGAGGLEGTFSVTATGEASFVLPIEVPAGRAGIEPRIALSYDSSSGDSVVGQGFSISGSSAITRCPKNLAQDGEIRAVRYDSEDKLCLDGKPLVVVGQEGGALSYRTFPDTLVKVLGRELAGGVPQRFEVVAPNGVVTEYGSSAASRPRGPGGVTRVWLAAVTRDARGNGMTYGYCFAETSENTVEYALDEIRYTHFEGVPKVEPSRAVKFVYGKRAPEQVRLSFSGGMALQRSLQLEEIQLVGPGDELVRRVDLGYSVSKTTGRTLLDRVEECAPDGVCKPATRFSYSRGKAEFVDKETGILAPNSRKASPMLLDIDGDGLDDLAIPDTDAALSTPQKPLTLWNVSHNGGAGTSGAAGAGLGAITVAYTQDDILVGETSGGSESSLIQPEVGTVIDYNQDGRKDVLLHNVYGDKLNWQVLIAQPTPAPEPDKAPTFELLDTGIPHPFSTGAIPTPPSLSAAGGSMHLADVNGDRVPDLIQCDDHGDSPEGNPGKPKWKVHLWKVAHGDTPLGFDPVGEKIELLDDYRCDVPVRPVDLDGDGKANLVTLSLQVSAEGSETAGAAYQALSRREDGKWEVRDIGLPVVNPGGRVLFLDVNGDGLPDAVESGFSNGALYTYVNTGDGFDPNPVTSLGDVGYGGQSAYFHLATVIDWNGDGRQDILMPVPDATLPASSGEIPVWVILEAKGGLQARQTFSMKDAHIPFEAELDEAVTLADPFGPRIGDLNGDGASDVVIWLGGKLHIFENQAVDQDLLVQVHDGMNAHDPVDPDYVPDVSVNYGHILDGSVTGGTLPLAPANEEQLYLSKWNGANDCTYPRRCVVGSRRVVSGYSLNDGNGGERQFAVKYRDGRFDVEHGFLGFGTRILTDLETSAATVDFYDNVAFDQELKVYPFANRSVAQWRFSPGLSSQPNPEQVEMSFLELGREILPTNEGKTYLALVKQSHLRRVQGSFVAKDLGPTLFEYVRQAGSGDAANAAVLRNTTAKITKVDDFGNSLTEEMSTIGTDLTFQVQRTFENNTIAWILSQLTSQETCSTAANSKQCRTLTRTPTTYGEAETESVKGNDDSAKLTVSYGRDGFGNVREVTLKDESGKERKQNITYDSEGLFPQKRTNAEGHITLTEFDPRLGGLTRFTDENGLVTEHKLDGFGRVGIEIRPDGTKATFTVTRTKDGGPDKNAWRVRERTSVTGGQDSEVELDSFGRPVRRWWFGPTPEGESNLARLTQEVRYDPRTGKIARRSVPIREDTAAAKVFFDEYEYDALGREVRHVTPWDGMMETSHVALLVESTDPLGNVTIAERDPLGRTLKMIDAANGITTYNYGPFGNLEAVTDPEGAITRSTYDALGRMRKQEDPDRGITLLDYNGFGELITSVDALGRKVTFEHDGLGRMTKRIDQEAGELSTTVWKYDTALHGKGELHKMESPDGLKTYAYNALTQLESLTLAITDENETFQAKIGYDGFARVETLTYPTPQGAAPFVVKHDVDEHGFVRKVRDRNSDLTYWNLASVDNAGRIETEEFGNGTTTTKRSYFSAQQRLKSITTESGAGVVQSLHYEWDARLDLKSRTDDLQPQNTTERFRVDALERLTCSYFSLEEDVSAPCAWSYEYSPNGNLTFKSDVGALNYADPKHPHAATSAGGTAYSYNAVGNQTGRPASSTVEYTPFDLPRKITQGATVITFGYDGDQKRIRKTSPTEETLYFGDWMERVTELDSGKTTHRYYVHSPERTVAIVTRSSVKPGVTYLHTDHLGSVDVLTDSDGSVMERRSYDAFGQRRNPEWGAPAPASFPSVTTRGFTGHETDGELGLINMKGRIFDPKLGRFLTTDPIVADPTFSQDWNPYSYVANNPLTYIDPSGFQAKPEEPVSLPAGPGPTIEVTVQGVRPVRVFGPPPPPIGPPEDDTNDGDLGGDEDETDVDTTGSDPGTGTEPEKPTDWKQNPYVQTIAGAWAGFGIGTVPFGGTAEQLATQGGLLSKGSAPAQRGLAFGIMAGGLFTMIGGVTGEVLGGAASATGIGTAIGVPAMVVSTTLVLGGAANVLAGAQALMSAPSGNGPPSETGSRPTGGPKAGSSGGPGAGKKFTEPTKDAAEAQANGKCVFCGKETTRTAGPNQRNTDHAQPKSRGGNNSLDNAQNTCRDCNLDKRAQTTDEYLKGQE